MPLGVLGGARAPAAGFRMEVAPSPRTPHPQLRYRILKQKRVEAKGERAREKRTGEVGFVEGGLWWDVGYQCGKETLGLRKGGEWQTGSLNGWSRISNHWKASVSCILFHSLTSLLMCGAVFLGQYIQISLVYFIGYMVLHIRRYAKVCVSLLMDI